MKTFRFEARGNPLDESAEKRRVGYLFDLDRETIWVLGSTRKRHKCARCGAWIEKGTMAFRPVTDRAFRGMRLHWHCAKASVVPGRTIDDILGE